MNRACFSLVLLVGLWLGGCARQDATCVSWKTMSTTASVRVRGGDAAYLAACRETAVAACREVERQLNAFDPVSELSRLATKSDGEVLARCAPAMRPCYAAAFRMAAETGGAFSPRWRGTNTLDLGAIAKGFAVDLACARIAASPGAADVLLDVGGNLRSVRGSWRVGIYGGERTLTLEPGMACATSGTYFRGAHIVDARTGRKAAPHAYSVTVVHPSSAMLADALSTTLFVLGCAEGDAFLRRHYPEASSVWIDAREKNENPH